jgi:hypothetical protein
VHRSRNERVREFLQRWEREREREAIFVFARHDDMIVGPAR